MDDDILYVTNENLKLLETLQNEFEIAIEWYKNNDMTANPDRFQSIIISFKKNQGCKPALKVDSAEIKPASSVSLISIETDNKLNISKHVSNLSVKASRQLNARCRLQDYMNLKGKETTINSFVRCVRVVLNDYSSNYLELLQSSGSVSMETQRLHTIAYEVLKTLNNLNQNSMKETFYHSPHLSHGKNNPYIHFRNTATFWNETLFTWNTHMEIIG